MHIAALHDVFGARQVVLREWYPTCPNTPAHTRALARLVQGTPPRRPAERLAAAVSGIEVVYPGDDNRPLLVGERTNVIGSRKLKDLIVEDKFEEAAEVGRAQVRGGGQVLDV